MDYLSDVMLANFKMNFPYEVYTDMDELYRTIQQHVKT